MQSASQSSLAAASGTQSGAALVDHRPPQSGHDYRLRRPRQHLGCAGRAGVQDAVSPHAIRTAALLNSAFFWSYAFLQIPAGLAGRPLRRQVPVRDRLPFLEPDFGRDGAVRHAHGSSWRCVFCWAWASPSSRRPACAGSASTSPKRSAGFAVGLYMTGTKIGPAIGAPVAAWLITAYDWRMMFLLLGIGMPVVADPLDVAGEGRRPADRTRQPARTGRRAVGLVSGASWPAR